MDKHYTRQCTMIDLGFTVGLFNIIHAKVRASHTRKFSWTIVMLYCRECFLYNFWFPNSLDYCIYQRERKNITIFIDFSCHCSDVTLTTLPLTWYVLWNIQELHTLTFSETLRTTKMLSGFQCQVNNGFYHVRKKMTN